jgi:hypothetical protein
MDDEVEDFQEPTTIQCAICHREFPMTDELRRLLYLLSKRDTNPLVLCKHSLDEWIESSPLGVGKRVLGTNTLLNQF